MDTKLDFDKLSEEIFEIKSVNDKQKIDNIRNILNEWSNKIPNHDIKDMGNKIEILEFYEKPSYIVSLETQYEKRILREGTVAYNGEEILQKTVNKANVKIWSYDSKPIFDFKEKKDKIKIENSQEIIECPDCIGKGEIKCNHCHGQGKTQCSRCLGAREISCQRCNGAGRIRCNVCGGTGELRDQRNNATSEANNYLRPCNNCRGGYNPCFCSNGRVVCPNCNGVGMTICNTCRGSGWISCIKCSGKGRIVRYLYIDIDFWGDKFDKNFNFKELPEDIITGKPDVIYNDKGLECSLIKEPAYQVLNVFFDKLEENDFIKLNFDGMNTAINELINNIKTKNNSQNNNLGVFNEDYKVIKQRLVINKIDIKHIKYKYDDRPYELWIYGNNNKIYAPSNPIKEIEQFYFSKAKDLFEQKCYSDALDEIEKAYQMEPDLKEIKALRSKIKGNIGLQYLFGGIIGGVVSSAILNILYFAANLILPSLKKLSVDVGIKIALFSLIASFFTGIISIFIFNTKERFGEKRILKGFFVTAIFLLISFTLFVTFIYINPNSSFVKDFFNEGR